MFMAFGVGITALKYKEGVLTLILSEVIKQDAHWDRHRGDLRE